ncbi:MAG: ABC transporter permease subunit [Candidatus Saccharimonas sp.]
MTRSIFLKTLYDKRWFIFGWSLVFAALAALMASFFPAMKVGTIGALANSLPPAFKGLIGNLALLNSFDTYLSSQLFDIRLPLIAGIMAIILGLGLSTSEEETGELKTLLGLPLSRTKIVFEKWLAIITITGVTMVAIAIAVYAVIPFVAGASMPIKTLLPLLGVSWLLMVTFGTIAYAAGVITGKRSTAMAFGVFVVIGSFILTTFGQSVDWLASYEHLSLLYYFPADDIVTSGVNWPDVAVLASVTVIFLVAALIVFRRRDVA